MVFEADTANILREELVHTCSKFRDCGTLLSQLYLVTSPVGADVFRTFVEALNGVSPTITNESVSDIRLLCRSSATKKFRRPC